MVYPLGEVLLAIALAAPVMAAAAAAAVRLGFPVTPLSDRLGYVDGLRGLLAPAVMAHHFALWISLTLEDRGWSPPNTFTYNLGRGGVALFFMITGLVFHRYAAEGIERVDWRKLLISRGFRILPLSLVVVALVAALSWALAGDARRLAPVRDVVRLLKWLSGVSNAPLFGYPDSWRLNAGVMWSLGYEWLFYLAVLPATAAVYALLRGRLPSYVPPFVLLGAAFLFRLRAPHSYKPSYLLLFALGFLVAEARTWSGLTRRLRSPLVAALILTLVALAMTLSDEPYGPAPMIAYTLLLLAVASGNSLFGVLETAPVRALGDASFSIYMLHGLVLSALMPVLVARTAPHPAWWLPLVAVVAAVVSLASYVLVERPMIEWGKRVAHWRPRRDRSLEVEVAP